MAERSQREGHAAGWLEHTNRAPGEQVRYIGRRDRWADLQILQGKQDTRLVRDIREEQHQRRWVDDHLSRKFISLKSTYYVNIYYYLESNNY